jgi:endoglucanase
VKVSLRQGAASIVIAALFVALVPVAAAAVPAAPTPVVQGNRLVDTQTNATFVPHGVNVPGLEYSCVQGWRHLPDAGEFAAMASWKINTVRLPLNESCWLGLDGSPTGSSVTQYKTDVKTWVDGVTAAGMAVILDLHWNAPAGYTASGQRAMPDERSTAFWTSVATTYSANKSVLFELFNEPYSRSGFTLTWDCWKNGGCLAPVENDATGGLSGAKYTVTGMQALVTAIRSTGATQPLLLGGLNYSNDLTGWIANKPTDPANQLVAAWHNYPGQGCSTACWNSTITTVAASVPIVTTEFGNTAETTSTAAGNSGNYLVPFMTWADAHGIGYLPWAWWDVSASEAAGNGSDIYALYTGSSFAPKAPSGTKFHDYLASLGGTPPTSTPSPTPTSTPSDPPTDPPAASTAFLKDYSGDGKVDVVARTSAGDLYVYPGNGSGGWHTATSIGSGWNGFTSIFSPGDFSGDGHPDVLARDGSGGLWLFKTNGSSGWNLPATLVGSGWSGFTSILGSGDFSGDAHPDVLARDGGGNLWLFRSNGASGWILPATLVGSGFAGFTGLIGPGDFSGDGKPDILARDGGGSLWLYRSNGAGGWNLPAILVGSGWASLTMVP